MILHLFKKVKLSNKLPPELQEILSELAPMRDKEIYLRSAYDLFISRYQGYRFLVYKKFFDLFVHKIERLVRLGNKQHCTAMNYMFRTLLVASQRFTSDDIQVKFTLIWYISPHQYLEVKVNDNKWVNIDLWGSRHGIEYGNFARGFNN